MWERAAGLNYEDHPRVCGEKLTRLPRYRAILGSPPRMRGKVGDKKSTLLPKRITPAYAGKRLSVNHKLFAIKDHPRVCGEKQRDFFSYTHF